MFWVHFMDRRYHRRARPVRLSLGRWNFVHLNQRLEPAQVLAHGELRVFPENCQRRFPQHAGRRRIFHFRGDNRPSAPRRASELHRSPILKIGILRRPPRQEFILAVLSDLRSPSQPLTHRTDRRPLRSPVALLAHRFEVTHENRQVFESSPHSVSRFRRTINRKARPRVKLRRPQFRSAVRDQPAGRRKRGPPARQGVHRQCAAPEQHSPALQRLRLRPAVTRIAPHFPFARHICTPILGWQKNISPPSSLHTNPFMVIRLLGYLNAGFAGLRLKPPPRRDFWANFYAITTPRNWSQNFDVGIKR